jgi:ComF family protein
MSDQLANRVLAAAADLFWPRRCAACNQRLPAGSERPVSSVFCSTCVETLVPARPPLCPRCGSTHETGRFDHLCGTCLADPPPFESARAPYLYGGALADAISRLKYSAATWLADPLGDLLENIEIGAPPDLIVPVPLHPRRLVERGFNQSALLAARMARRLGLTLDTSILTRTVDTRPQARQTRSKRLNALHGAFSARKPGRVAGAQVLLFDDVVTTTATVRAATGSLLRAGAVRVDVVSLARAEWPDRVADRVQTG